MSDSHDHLLEIRPAIHTDFEAVAELLVTSYEPFMSTHSWFESYRTELGNTAQRATVSSVLVAELDGAIAGTVTVYTDTDRHGSPRPPDAAVQVGMLAVTEATRSKGVGRQLMEAVIRDVAPTDRTTIALHTMPGMLDAQRLYDRMGFSRDRDEDRFDDEGKVELLGYRLDLN